MVSLKPSHNTAILEQGVDVFPQAVESELPLVELMYLMAEEATDVVLRYEGSRNA